MTAYARATDPRTSWEAAESLTDDTVRASQQLVLSYVRSVGRAYSIEIENALHANLPGRSRARIRTAISELRKKDLLEIIGYGRPPGTTRRTMILTPTRKEETPDGENEGHQTRDIH